jgi:hypothetical protein
VRREIAKLGREVRSVHPPYVKPVMKRFVKRRKNGAAMCETARRRLTIPRVGSLIALPFVVLGDGGATTAGVEGAGRGRGVDGVIFGALIERQGRRRGVAAGMTLPPSPGRRRPALAPFAVARNGR